MKKSIIAICLLLCTAGLFAQENQAEIGPQQQSPQTVVVVRKETPSPVPAHKGYDWREHRQSVSISVGLPSIYSTAFGSHAWNFYIPAPGSTSTARRSEIFTGAWAIDYGYNILRWLRLGASANYECWAGNDRTHDVSLIGLNFGNERVFGLVETNIGSASVLRVGIGFRP